jgi:glycosyltransferase involved in cell wall biosynthesis
MSLIVCSQAPLLSAILIVKNEEKRLARALTPLKRAGCEIIVTDTGSTDRTIEIAREFGAQIFDFPWNGDEAAARNISLQNATGKWVFWVDADEIADEELVQSILRDLPRYDLDPRIQTASVIMRNVYQGNSTSLTPMLRLARRREDLKFEGEIHPQLSFRPEIGSLKGILLHEGYQWTPELRKRKAAHMRTHLEPLCRGEKPPFHRWCELLSVLLIGDETEDFWRYWKKRSLYSEEERYRGPYAHYWQDNTTNVLLFFSRQECDAEGVALANELLLHHPEQISAHFFILRQAVKERRWRDVLSEVVKLEEAASRPPQFYNTFYPEIHGEPAQVWKKLAESSLNTEAKIDWGSFSHPRHVGSWIYSAIHFGDRIETTGKWEGALIRLLQEWKSKSRDSSVIRLNLEKISGQFEEGKLLRCAADLFRVVLVSEAPPSPIESLKTIEEFTNRYSDLNSLGNAFGQMEPGQPLKLEWFYEEGLHRV